jgi:hypothetical protein
MSHSKQSASEFTVLNAAHWSLRSAIAGCVLLVSGCGGGATPPAETPEAETSPKEESASKQAADTEPSSAAAQDTAPASKAEESSARSVLLHEGTAFLLNQEKSDIGIKAHEACEKQSKGDVAKKANCSSKAMNKMKREGFMLESAGGNDDEDEGEAKAETWIYVGFNIEKGIKVETNRVEVSIPAGSGKSLTIKTKGPDKAKRRQGTVPSEITFTVPDEYTVLVNDSPRGKLVYEPKLGLFAGNN